MSELNLPCEKKPVFACPLGEDGRLIFDEGRIERLKVAEVIFAILPDFHSQERLLELMQMLSWWNQQDVSNYSFGDDNQQYNQPPAIKLVNPLDRLSHLSLVHSVVSQESAGRVAEILEQSQQEFNSGIELIFDIVVVGSTLWLRLNEQSSTASAVEALRELHRQFITEFKESGVNVVTEPASRRMMLLRKKYASVLPPNASSQEDEAKLQKYQSLLVLGDPNNAPEVWQPHLTVAICKNEEMANKIFKQLKGLNMIQISIRLNQLAVGVRGSGGTFKKELLANTVRES